MRYVFGDYVLDTQRQELHHAGEPIMLRRKVFQVLAYLLAHCDRVIPKQELLEHLWPAQFVGDAALTSCVKALRRALGERGRTPRLVRTLHGQGYRFVAPVAVHKHLPADDVPHPLAPSGGEGWGEEALHEATLPLASVSDGEHKQVTVLCGALVEAPTLAARLGPEAMYHLMRAVLTLAQDTVQRYDGSLTQVSGDGFLTLFGAPVAQEDHALRGEVWNKAVTYCQQAGVMA